MEEEKTNAPRRFLWIRWIVYFVISTTVLFFIFNEAVTSHIRHGLLDSYGQISLCSCICFSLVILVAAKLLPNVLSQSKGKGRYKRRLECADLYGMSLCFSAIASIAASFGLLFGGVRGMIPFLMLFAIIAFLFIYSSIELALAQFIPDSGWETVAVTSLAVFGPALVIGIFDVCIWLVKYCTIWTFVGVGLAVAVIYDVAHDLRLGCLVTRLWKRINERKSNHPSPSVECVGNPVSRASFILKLDFSSNLKKLRESACRTEESVARKAGLPVGELRKIESCMNNFNMSAAFACLKTLDHHIEVENEEGSVTLCSAGDALSWLAGMVCGLPVEQVASDAGISPTILEFAIDGKIPLSIDVFAGICSLFRASVKFVRNRQELQVTKK